MASTTVDSCLAFCPTNKQVIALLPSLCAGASSPFVHRADVSSAAPAELVGNLRPAQGDGHGSVWYLLCPKKYKSNVGKRLRVVAAGKECWHAEAGPKKVEVLVYGTHIVGYVRTFSYGYKTAAKHFKRLGWCMVEYSMEDARYDQVLCKVYRSPRAKASSSNSASLAMEVLPSSGSKGKAAGQLTEARTPARLSTQLTHEPPMMPVQVQHGAAQSFYFQEGLPGTKDALTVQHSAGGQVLDGYVFAEGPELGDTGSFSTGFSSFDGEELAGIDVEELLNQPNQTPTEYDQLASQVAEAAWPPPPDDHFFDDLPFLLY